MRRGTLLLAAAIARVSPAPPLPLPWPPAFSVSFTEFITPFAGQSLSSGRWLYSAGTNEWRAEHGHGKTPQFNNFCNCASNSTAPCALVFTHTGHMFVDYPSEPALCCHLCDAADGCSVLKPDWLSGAAGRTYVGSEIVGGETCYEYCIPGADAVADCLLFRADQTPCRYSESFNFSGLIVHNLTFDQSSFLVGPQPRDAFNVRPECEKACPRTFPTTCG